MTAIAFLTIVFFGACAGLALWAGWRRPDLRWIGAAIATSFVISNLLWALGVPAPNRTGIYTFLEIMIQITTWWAWAEHRHRALMLLLTASLFSVAANVGLASFFNPTQRQIFLWEATTNLCFFVESLLLCWVGIEHGYQSGRFTRRFSLRRGSPSPHAARQDGQT